MASIVVRGLDPEVKEQLAAQAREHGRSMEAEVRDILGKAARRPGLGAALLRAGESVGGFDDVEIPPRRDEARSVDFG
ncbi:FitA-like ribbon-helix-helix domain-containing protein [Kytococcus sp. Marseille-QA3725]